MDEINKDIFRDFKKHIQTKGFKLDEASETSIRGIIRHDFWIHLFYDFSYYEYILNITLDGHQHINFFFNIEDNIIKVRKIYSRNNDLDGKPIIFNNIMEIINYTNDNTELNI